MRVARRGRPLLDPVDLEFGYGIGGRSIPDVDRVGDRCGRIRAVRKHGFGFGGGQEVGTRVGEHGEPACVRAMIV